MTAARIALGACAMASCRLLAPFLLLIPCLAAAAAGESCVRSLSYLDGEVILKPAQSIEYVIEVIDTMYDARISVWLEVTQGNRREIGCSLFPKRVNPGTDLSDGTGLVAGTDSEYVADPGFETDYSDRSTERSFRVWRAQRIREQRCPSPGTYVATIWNPSERTGSRIVRGFIRLTWIHDPKRAAADRMRAKVRFVDFPRESAAVLDLESRAGVRRVTISPGTRPSTRSFLVDFGPSDRSGRRSRFESSADEGPEIGVVDFDGDGNQELLLVGTSGGSGGAATELTLLVPSKAVLVDPSARAHRRQHLHEVAYLESLKVAFQESFDDFVEAGDDDPRFTFQRWTSDNGGIDNGRMKICRQSGLPAHWGQELDTIEVDGIHYMAHFRSGVDAYDPRADENFVVFDPGDQYAWAEELDRAGPYLIIYSRSSTIAIVDCRTCHLYRLTREDAGGDVNGAFTLVDGTLLVRGTPIDELMASKSRRR